MVNAPQSGQSSPGAPNRLLNLARPTTPGAPSPSPWGGAGGGGNGPMQGQMPSIKPPMPQGMPGPQAMPPQGGPGPQGMPQQRPPMPMQPHLPVPQPPPPPMTAGSQPAISDAQPPMPMGSPAPAAPMPPWMMHPLMPQHPGQSMQPPYGMGGADGGPAPAQPAGDTFNRMY